MLNDLAYYGQKTRITSPEKFYKTGR
jgi:hypothetical protein